MKGVVGENIISKGVWKIDFKNKKIVFTSSLDSLSELQQAELFPSSFANDRIKVRVSFRNNKYELLDLDFGFNGSILLPPSDFAKVSQGNIYVRKADLRFSTPGSQNDVTGTLTLDSIGIRKNKFLTTISTNKLAAEKLIGLGFFQRFEFVIFDYKNSHFYVSKKEYN